GLIQKLGLTRLTFDQQDAGLALNNGVAPALVVLWKRILVDFDLRLEQVESRRERLLRQIDSVRAGLEVDVLGLQQPVIAQEMQLAMRIGVALDRHRRREALALSDEGRSLDL